MKVSPRPNSFLDAGGIIVGLVVDLVLNIVGFSILAPDFYTRIAFIAIGVMIVLFVPRSWSRRQFLVYAIFVSVVFFFDYSLILESTRAQTQEATAGVDAELSRIQTDIEDVKKSIVDWQTQYKAASKRDTMDQINAQLETENAKLTQYQSDYKAREKEIESGDTEKVALSADNIFNAIPNAIKDHRYIPLVVFALIFIGLQAIIATSIDTKTPGKAVRKRKPAKKQEIPDITRNDVTRWVHWSWYRILNGQSDYIISKNVFYEGLKKQNIEFPETKYDYLLKRAKQKKVIDRSGHALVSDEETAVNKIIGE